MQPGDTLRQIVLRTMGEYNGDTIEQIRKLNPDIADFDHLETGQAIRIPRASVPVEARSCQQVRTGTAGQELKNEPSRMSKNFELLLQVAKDDFFNLPAEPASAPPSPPPQKAPAAIPVRKEPPDTEISKLVQRLFSQAGKGSGPKVVSFSGIARDDRSSWICARAGEALAEQADASVCIVEANLWSPQLHVHLAAANQIGLAEALTTKGPIRSFATPLCGENLWLIPSGVVKPGFYPSMERYRERFAELREAFDYILISAPALSRETEATFIGQLADGIVLIVEANHSRRETVRRAKEQLESAHVRLLGCSAGPAYISHSEKVCIGGSSELILNSTEASSVHLGLHLNVKKSASICFYLFFQMSFHDFGYTISA